MKYLLLSLLLVVGCLGQVNTWHSLTKLTPSERSSSSYKFLVSKFGANNLLVECDTEEASMMGGDWLIQVMGEGSDTQVGETIGHGSNLQEALDSAAAQYMSPARVKAIQAKLDQEERERQRREAEYRKKCCAQ